MPPFILLLMLALIISPDAQAQIYKCRTGDNATIYSDRPCQSGRQTEIDIQSSPTAVDGGVKVDASLRRRLDAAVKAAILRQDYARAEALAATDEQRAWIAAARKQAAAGEDGRSEPALRAEKHHSAQCEEARRDLELAADSARDSAVLDAKTSLMRVACGEPEVVQSHYGIAGFPFFGIPPHFNRLPKAYKPEQPYTSPPYDRTRARPFGSRWIRPDTEY